MQYPSSLNPLGINYSGAEHRQEADFELAEADLEEIVAGNPIVSFNKYFACKLNDGMMPQSSLQLSV
ncbi:MAG: hypothetical protein AAGF01_33040 [Cyanobacteria bacterium P01_G01_bin.38]